MVFKPFSYARNVKCRIALMFTAVITIVGCKNLFILFNNAYEVNEFIKKDV